MKAILKWIASGLGLLAFEHLVTTILDKVYNDLPGEDLKIGSRLYKYTFTKMSSAAISAFRKRDKDGKRFLSALVVTELEAYGIRYYKTYVCMSSFLKYVNWLTFFVVYIEDTSDNGKESFNHLCAGHADFINLVTKALPGAIPLSEFDSANRKGLLDEYDTEFSEEEGRGEDNVR